MALAYDRAIDWEARLGREIPFLLQHLPPEDGLVLDIACGSGRHLVALAEHGHRGVGIDISSQMIEQARQLASEHNVDLEFNVMDMRNVGEMDVRADLVICLGNSLSLLSSRAEVIDTLRGMASVLAANGRVVIQVLNSREVLESGFRFFPLTHGQMSDGRTVVFARFFEHWPAESRSTLVMTGIIGQDDEWATTVRTQSVLHLNREILNAALREAGLAPTSWNGGYDGRELDERQHRSIVVVARRMES